MRFIHAIIFHPVVSHRHSHTHPVYIHIPPSLLQFYVSFPPFFPSSFFLAYGPYSMVETPLSRLSTRARAATATVDKIEQWRFWSNFPHIP